MLKLLDVSEDAENSLPLPCKRLPHGFRVVTERFPDLLFPVLLSCFSGCLDAEGRGGL